MSTDPIDAEYHERIRVYREAVEYAIARFDDPVPAIANLRVPRREDCVPLVRNLDAARTRVDAWNTVTANPQGYAGLVAIIPDLTEHLGHYSEIANAMHIGAETEGGMYADAETMTHHLLMLAAIALEYAEGRMYSVAFDVTDETEIR